MVLWVSATVLGTVGTAAAEVRRVDDDNQTGVEDGSALHPYSTVQEAVDASATTGDTVQVAAGTYGGGTKVNRKQLTLLGGFAGGTAAAYAAGTAGDFSDGTRSPSTHATVLTGVASSSSPVGEGALLLLYTKASVVDGFVVSGSSRGMYVYGESAAESSPTISNNLIENNGLLDANYGQGAGIWAVKGAVTIRANVIRGNHGSRGAGIASFCSSFLASDNLIENNIGHADHAGGIYLSGASVTFTHNVVRGNECCKSTGDGGTPGYGWGGGGLVFQNGNSAPGATKAYLAYNVWTNNKAGSSGDAIFVDDKAEATFDHELVFKNRCSAHGQAVYVDGYDTGSTVRFVNSTIVDNACGSQGAFFLERGSKVSVESSILWNNGGKDFTFGAGPTNTITFAYSLSEETQPGTGNLKGDPLFASAATGDYHLRSTVGRYDDGNWVVDATDSPAIDSGDPAAAFDLEPAPNGDRVNMGHDGNTCEASLGAAGGGAAPGECADAPPPPPPPFPDAGPPPPPPPPIDGGPPGDGGPVPLDDAGNPIDPPDASPVPFDNTTTGGCGVAPAGRRGEPVPLVCLAILLFLVVMPAALRRRDPC
jgi:hypothetical protein